MRKPTYYTGVVHSYLNTLTGRNIDKEDCVKLIVANPDIKAKNTKVAEMLYNYYACINSGRLRPGNYENVVSQYITKLG